MEIHAFIGSAVRHQQIHCKPIIVERPSCNQYAYLIELYRIPPTCIVLLDMLLQLPRPESPRSRFVTPFAVPQKSSRAKNTKTPKPRMQKGQYMVLGANTGFKSKRPV